MAERLPVDYDAVAGSAMIVFPTRLYDEFAVLLHQAGIEFKDVRMAPLSALTPEQQAERRRLTRRHRIA